MPTRKQRRRRQKELRHEYEYVYVDGEGQEVEVDQAELEAASPRRNGKREAKATPGKSRGGKAIREVQPPSWNRVLKRVLFIAPLLFLAFSALNHDQSVLNRLAAATLGRRRLGLALAAAARARSLELGRVDLDLLTLAVAWAP